jgi:hypothetical protein
MLTFKRQTSNNLSEVTARARAYKNEYNADYQPWQTGA